MCSPSPGVGSINARANQNTKEGVMLQKKRHIVAAAAIAGLFAVSGIAPPAKAEVPESKDPIKLVIMG